MHFQTKKKKDKQTAKTKKQRETQMSSSSSSPKSSVELSELDLRPKEKDLPKNSSVYFIKAVETSCFIGCEEDGSLCFVNEDKVKELSGSPDKLYKLKWVITFRDDGTCLISTGTNEYVLTHIHIHI